MNLIDRLSETLTQKMLKVQVGKLQKKLQKMTVQYQVNTLNWTVPPDAGQSDQGLPHHRKGKGTEPAHRQDLPRAGRGKTSHSA